MSIFRSLRFRRGHPQSKFWKTVEQKMFLISVRHFLDNSSCQFLCLKCSHTKTLQPTVYTLLSEAHKRACKIIDSVSLSTFYLIYANYVRNWFIASPKWFETLFLHSLSFFSQQQVSTESWIKGQHLSVKMMNWHWKKFELNRKSLNITMILWWYFWWAGYWGVS
jgi:hypothetical protein